MDKQTPQFAVIDGGKPVFTDEAGKLRAMELTQEAEESLAQFIASDPNEERRRLTVHQFVILANERGKRIQQLEEMLKTSIKTVEPAPKPSDADLEHLKSIAGRDPLIVHGPADPFVRISTDEHKAIKSIVSFLTTPTLTPTGSSNPIYKKDDSWFFWDETWSHSYGPYKSEALARFNLALYVAVQLEGLPEAMLVTMLMNQRQVVLPPLEKVLASEIEEALAATGVTVDEATAKNVVDTVVAHLTMRSKLLDEERIKRLINEHYEFMRWKNWTSLHVESIQFICDLILDKKDRIEEAMKNWKIKIAGEKNA